MMKSEKYQRAMARIMQLVVYWIMYIYRLIAFDLSKQKDLEVHPRASQQIVFQGLVGEANNTKTRLYTILEQSKETILEFAKVL